LLTERYAKPTASNELKASFQAKTKIKRNTDQAQANQSEKKQQLGAKNNSKRIKKRRNKIKKRCLSLFP